MKGRILMIDDNALDLKVASSLMEKQGYACFGFLNHREALSWLNENQPQIILLDLQMPDVTGYELIPVLKAHPLAAKCPIIIMSGKNQVQDVSKAIMLGATDYIVKPIDHMVLQEKVEKLLLVSTGEEYASVPVPSGLFESCVTVKKIKLLLLSEFGARIQSSYRVEPGEMVEMGGLPLQSFGAEKLIARCLSIERKSEADDFTIQLTFVGLTELQRQSIRKLCRQLWIQSKGAAA